MEIIICKSLDKCKNACYTEQNTKKGAMTMFGFTTILNTENVRGMYPMYWDTVGLVLSYPFLR